MVNIKNNSFQHRNIISLIVPPIRWEISTVKSINIIQFLQEWCEKVRNEGSHGYVPRLHEASYEYFKI